MAEQIYKDCKLYLGGYDLSGDHNQLSLKMSADIKDNTRFGATSRARTAGLIDIEANNQGYFEGGAGKVDDVLAGNLAVPDAVMTICPTDGAPGEPGYFFESVQGGYSPFASAAVGEIVPFDVTAQGSSGNPLVRGTVLENGSKTATGTGGGLNLGQVAAGQYLYAVVHVLSVSGTSPSITAVIESGADAGFTPTPTERITFADKTAIGAEFALRVPGPITDPWWRAKWTIAGTTPDFTVLVAVGIQ